MLKADDNEEVSLRPLSLRPGTAAKNPFASFGKGAGAAFRDKPKEDIFAPPVEEKRKPRGEVVKYSIDFLHSLSELHTQVPEELKRHTDVLLDATAGRPDPASAAQAPEPTDDRDWRARQGGAPSGEPVRRAAPTPAPQENGVKPQQQSKERAASAPQQQQPQQQSQPGAQQPAAPSGVAAVQDTGAAAAAAAAIQTAEEVGRKAWVPNSALTSDERAIRVVKGILNKLTPEKFEVLLGQLKASITNTEILHGSIALVFENAVAQPTFVKMYADLCDQLSKELPKMEGSEADTSRTFRRVLLNTCQEEFEGAAAAREGLKKLPAEEVEAAQRRVKQRTLGNIRLIAQLFNQGVVSEKIVQACIADLLGSPKSAPVEDNAEAICELLTTAGKHLDAQSKEKKRLDGYFTTLDKWAKAPILQPRIRFLIRDVVELRRSQWVPRRETLEAKKLTDIRAEAHAELGIVPATMMASLQTLPALQAGLPGLGTEEVELFPAFKHSDEGWQALVKNKDKDTAGQQQSALLGNYVALPVPKAAQPAISAAIENAGQRTTAQAPAPAPAPAPAEQPKAPAEPAKPVKKLDDEGRAAAAKSMLAEFIASNDTAEALTCVQEINAPGSGPALVRQFVEYLFDLTKEREQAMLVALVVTFLVKDAISRADFLSAMERFSKQLEDLSLDVPKAPKLLGDLVGHAVTEKALDLDVLPGLCSQSESAEPRRDFAAATFSYIKDKAGEEQLKELCTKAKLQAGQFLAAVPEIDPPDLPEPKAFLASQGLSAVPV